MGPAPSNLTVHPTPAISPEIPLQLFDLEPEAREVSSSPFAAAPASVASDLQKLVYLKGVTFVVQNTVTVVSVYGLLPHGLQRLGH